MFCATCGTTITPGLSFCNRCGASLKETTVSTVKTGSVVAFLIAITVIGLAGLGIMVGGALSLKQDANFTENVIGLFMTFTFFIVCLIEFFLLRQLSRVTGNKEASRVTAPSPVAIPSELRPAQPARGLPEAMPSVTENTTRTLEYSRRNPGQD